MYSTVTLTMVDGVQVVVPDSLDLITPYVLREQQDWFEDEIKFLRRLLQPGQQAIDIGANYGLYTLSIAKTVGSGGHVWAFEPSAATAALLADSIAVNGYGHVTLEQCALSDTPGTARLSMCGQAELNALVRDNEAGQPTEIVRVVSLDDYSENSDWQDIDLVKIDAEGEEANILKGGAAFFAGYSPLVQYEIKAGDKFNLELVQTFAALGYASYRLVPGLDLLVPFRADMPVDQFQLNLFACKPDRAARLASDGWLIEENSPSDPAREFPQDVSHEVPDLHAFNWRATLLTLPYGKELSARWEQGVTNGRADTFEESLALFALSRDESRPKIERFGALDGSLRRLASLSETAPTQARLASLARVAQDFGARTMALMALRKLWNDIVENKGVKLDEPFLAPGERFDSVDPHGAIGNWMLIAVAEELERMQSFSSYYPGEIARNRLEMICSSDFAGPEMQRRLSLLREKFGAVSSTS